MSDWRPTEDKSNENFLAKFRLLPEYRKAQYTATTGYSTGGVQPYMHKSYGGYYYEKENLGVVGEKYYSEPVEYEYVIEQRGAPPMQQQVQYVPQQVQYVYQEVKQSPTPLRTASPFVQKQVQAKRTELLKTQSVDIKTMQTYSMYEKHKEAREQRES